jgi:intracellular multiplication protein IcmE
MQSANSSKGTLLLPAGRGVYGHAVLTVNSDLGNVVLAQIDSGPFRGARISGTFEMKSERLVIKFNRLMIGDADPIPVSGYAVSPKTAETGVASEVREHLATRIILPAAAAFVEGLGSAMMNSNTTNYSNGAGMSSFTHLDLAQQMGAAAGTMGQQLGQIIQKNTPQQATVILKQNDGIGILFDEPVYRP